MQRIRNILLAGAMLPVFAACTQNQVDRMRTVGQTPQFEKMDPVGKSEPISWPAMENKEANAAASNSLWSKGSKEFFRDQRARKIGDILTVSVSINDQAALDNKTQSKRSGDDSLGTPKLFGLEKGLAAALPGGVQPDNLLEVKSSVDNNGEGTIKRGEQVATKLSAVVTQVMDNGNLVIYGSQEVRVNFEVRQLTVQGVIRPEDIAPTNSIDASRIAEARISYGGKGLISEMQQPRIGQQITDILSPF